MVKSQIEDSSQLAARFFNLRGKYSSISAIETLGFSVKNMDERYLGWVELLKDSVQDALEHVNLLLRKPGFDLLVDPLDDRFCLVAFLDPLGCYVNPDGTPVILSRPAYDKSRSFKTINKTRQSGVFHSQSLAQLGHGLSIITF
jgi:hypothetical protein